MIKKLLGLLVLLLAFSATANATHITILTLIIPTLADLLNPTVPVYYSPTLTAINGTIGSGGSPNGGVVYKVITCTLVSGTVTVPTFTIQSTLDGIDSNSSRVTFYLYNGNAQISPNPLAPYANLMVPATIASATGCSPTGTCASLAELLIWNSPAPPLDPTRLERDASLRIGQDVMLISSMWSTRNRMMIEAGTRGKVVKIDSKIKVRWKLAMIGKKLSDLFAPDEYLDYFENGDF